MVEALYLERNVRIELKLGHEFSPLLKLVCGVVDVVVEHCAGRWELDGLELIGPPFGEVNSVIGQLILEERRSERPDTAEDEVELVQLLRTIWRGVLGH